MVVVKTITGATRGDRKTYNTEQRLGEKGPTYSKRKELISAFKLEGGGGGVFWKREK